MAPEAPSGQCGCEALQVQHGWALALATQGCWEASAAHWPTQRPVPKKGPHRLVFGELIGSFATEDVQLKAVRPRLKQLIAGLLGTLEITALDQVFDLRDLLLSGHAVRPGRSKSTGGDVSERDYDVATEADKMKTRQASSLDVRPMPGTRGASAT